MVLVYLKSKVNSLESKFNVLASKVDRNINAIKKGLDNLAEETHLRNKVMIGLLQRKTSQMEDKLERIMKKLEL